MATQRLTASVLLIFALLAPGASASLVQSNTLPAAATHPAFTGSMFFIENAGQWPAAARFLAWGSPLGAGTTWLAEDEIWVVASRQLDMDQVDKDGESRCDAPLVSLSTCPSGMVPNLPAYSSVALKLTFPGSNPAMRIEPFEALTTTVSYFTDNDPSQWHPAVPVWEGVRYVDLFPGVDLVWGYSSTNNAPWALEAQPGAEASDIILRVEGVDSAWLDGRLLHVETSAGEFALPLPAAGFPLQVEIVTSNGSLRSLGATPGVLESRPALDSPQRAPADNPADLLYSTFLGAGDEDYGMAVAVDATGSAYVTGYTRSSDFPVTPGAFDPDANGLYDAVVVKLNPAGSGLAYATYLGGSSWDYGSAIAVDSAGSAYVSGNTSSSSFPTTPGAFEPTFNGGSCNDDPCPDAFVVKLNPTGSSLVYGTFLGGTGSDGSSAIATDGTGSAFVTGGTSSGDFPITPGAFDMSYNGEGDAFVVSLNPAGSDLVYATFLGGTDVDGGSDIVMDGNGSAYLAGSTGSSNFPSTPGAFDPSFNSPYDAFVVKLNPAGSDLAYAAFLGSNSFDMGQAIAVDGAGSAYVTGLTYSGSFPTTPGAFDTSWNGGEDAFAAKLNQTGSALDYATYLGGYTEDAGHAITVDAAGSAYVTGHSRSIDFPTTPNSFDPSFNNGDDTFMVKLNPAGYRLVYGTFLGGSGGEGGNGIAVDETGNAYVTGYTDSTNFPATSGAFDPNHNGGTDVFVAKLVRMEPTAVTLITLEAVSPDASTQMVSLLTVLLALALAASVKMMRRSARNPRNC